MKYGKHIVLFSLVAMNLVAQPAPEVIIEQGILSGIINKDGTVFEYLGIPYATADSSTRFQAPGPPPSWNGTYKAIEEIYTCPQNSVIGVIGSEDCLKVNVYVPAMPKKKPLAVMVYIHGGAFILGSGSKLIYGPEFLIKKDVILVTFNYRLGLLGFLCLRIKEAPGNVGLKDQIAALKWVKKNIAAFGGDPENITVFGESAGATSVSILLVSQAAKGLFKRAIIQSGSAVSNWSINRKPVWVASLLTKSIGYDTENPNEIYEILSKMDYKELTQLSAKKPLDVFYDTQLIHLPCVEYNITGEEPILNDLPYNLFVRQPMDGDIIYGTASKEGMFLVAEETEEVIQERNGRYLFASDLKFSSEVEAKEIADEVKQFYFGQDNISLSKFDNMSNLYTDLYFEVPAVFESEYLVNKLKSKVYNYIFEYSGARNFMKIRGRLWNESGACHGDDLFYLFNGQLMIPFKIKEKDAKVIEYMTSMWTNFAKYGNPTPDLSIPVKWMPSTKEGLKFLYIDSELRMGSMPNPESYQLWKRIYGQYRKTDID